MPAPSVLPRALFTFLLLLLPAPFRAQDSELFTLKAEVLNNARGVALDELPWRYMAGDDAAWAAKDYDDSSWQRLTNEQINDDLSTLGNWQGRAWFRLHLQVDEGLVNQPLVLRVWHWGASEIYVDGELVQRFGSIEADGDEEYNPRGLFVPVVFQEGDHTIAVRYSFKAAGDMTRGLGRAVLQK